MTQIKGTSMGTQFAPSYENLVMGYLEVNLYEEVKNNISVSLHQLSPVLTTPRFDSKRGIVKTGRQIK